MSFDIEFVSQSVQSAVNERCGLRYDANGGHAPNLFEREGPVHDRPDEGRFSVRARCEKQGWPFVPDLIEQLEMRPAAASDIDILAAISTGPVAGKRDFLAASLERRSVVAATHQARIVGVIVWDQEFFGRPFVWHLGVDSAYRRRGIARGLIAVFASRCAGRPLFVSTNASNAPMRALLERLGFVPSGRLDNLDPGDPELFFYKPPAPTDAVGW